MPEIESSGFRSRVIGLNRGFQDTTVDIVADETWTFQDIDGIPEGQDIDDPNTDWMEPADPLKHSKKKRWTHALTPRLERPRL